MEVYDELQEALKEIERLNYIIDKQDRDIVALSNGNRKLSNIINEVREFAINNNVRGLYELLDKENK